eukprot:snap_masked-scaffold711_size108467-processed-gene-0.13 protein:Tk04241 transcript:snap_masked-scaffold711_size108467-processed-gene-0.13-mRNA-1 annotation:"mical-like protein 2"
MPIQRRGMRALQIWCDRVTRDYKNVQIVDMTTSFKNGLAFCAIIHHFKPELIDFESLDAANVLDNNALAFRIAEEELKIPALLEAQDMVDCDEPDKFSVITYVSQFYHMFKDADDSRLSPSLQIRLTGRNSESENDSLIQSSTDNTPQGTPIIQPKRIFNQAELIAKYGEEIFSNSDKSSSQSSSQAPSPTIGMKSLCNDMVAKAKISPKSQ